MMRREDRDQRQLFYEFSLDEAIPREHLLRRINVFPMLQIEIYDAATKSRIIEQRNLAIAPSSMGAEKWLF